MSSVSVEVETISELERKMRVDIPADRVDQAIEKRLNDLQQTASLPGFRPGKVPRKLLEQRYADGVRYEVVDDLIKETLYQNIQDKSLRIAGAPKVDPILPKKGESLVYTAIFEVFPEIDLKPVNGEQIEIIESEIKDEDVEKTISKLQEQHVVYQSVTRPSQLKDQVNINFEGRLGDTPFEGGKAEGFDLVLGSGSMIPGFEDAICGFAPGDEKDIQVTFPENYNHAALAGKAATFKIKVNSVNEPTLPALDDELAKKYNVDSIENLKVSVRKRLLSQLRSRVKDINKKRVFKKVTELNPISIPKSMVKQEIEAKKQQVAAQFKMKDTNMIPDKYFKKSATHSVHLGLILSHIIETQKLQADGAKIQEMLSVMAEDYDDPAGYLSWFTSDKSRLENIKYAVIEEQIFDQYLKDFTVVITKLSFDELQAYQDPNDDEGFDDEDDAEDDGDHHDHENCDHDHDHEHCNHDH